MIKEETTNSLRHRQVILVETQIQILALMTTITIRMETMAGAGEVDDRNATLKEYQSLETLLPVHEAY